MQCGKIIQEAYVHTRCDECGGILDIEFDYEIIKRNFKNNGKSGNLVQRLSRAGLVPVKDFKKFITLQEGNTPLYKTDALGKKSGLDFLYVKNEGANPTGVFKDRGSCVEITKALEAGAKALIIASSGNMAASSAAYASKGGLKIYVLVPESTPVGKLSQIMSYGAHVVKIRGDYSTCVNLAESLAKDHGLYQTGDYVFRREGQKTLAYELVEQLDMRVPDVVVIPTGAGTHIAGLWKGFTELKKMGIIKKLPRMVAVQPDGCGVLLEAFKAKKKKYSPWKKADTICSAVAVTDPSDGDLALGAVYQSKGVIIGISDDEALDAQKKLAGTEGIFSEPSSALAIAALKKLHGKKFIGEKDIVVCVSTGNGLKDPMAALQNIDPPKTFEADLKAISRYIRSVHN